MLKIHELSKAEFDLLFVVTDGSPWPMAKFKSKEDAELFVRAKELRSEIGEFAEKYVPDRIERQFADVKPLVHYIFQVGLMACGEWHASCETTTDHDAVTCPKYLAAIKIADMRSLLEAAADAVKPDVILE